MVLWSGQGSHVAELRRITGEEEIHGGAEDEEADHNPVVCASEAVRREQHLQAAETWRSQVSA